MAVGVLGVLYIAAVGASTRLSPGFAVGFENGGKGQCQFGGRNPL